MAPLFSILAGACALTSAAMVQTPDGVIRVRDAVVLECIDLTDRARVGDLALASLPPRAERMAIARGALVTLARRRVPILGPLLGTMQGQTGEIVFARPRQEHAARACVAAAAPIQAGMAITGDMLEPVACEGEGEGAVANAVRFDSAAGVVRAARDLGAGENLGRLHPPAHAFPDAGDVATLNVVIGHASIARQVEVLQPAPHGGAVFVRDGDGQVFAAPVATQERRP